MTFLKESCKCCGVRIDKSKYKFHKIQSPGLISRLNRIYPNQTFTAGIFVCKNCRKKVEKTNLNDEESFQGSSFSQNFEQSTDREMDLEQSFSAIENNSLQAIQEISTLNSTDLEELPQRQQHQLQAQHDENEESQIRPGPKKIKKYFEKSRRQQRNDRKKLIECLKTANSLFKRLKLKINLVEAVPYEEEDETEDETETGQFNLIILNQNKNKINLVDTNMRILKAKDSAFISDQNYQAFKNAAELKMLPSKRSMKFLRNEIAKEFEIKSNASGFYTNLTQKLKMVINKLNSQAKEIVNDVLIVKFSGDSTNISNPSSKILNFAFTIINDNDVANSVKGNYIIGMFMIDKEDYDNVQVALKEILQCIESLELIEVNNKSYNIEKCIAGDMHFLSIMYGINEANSNYPCIWCKCCKKDFADLSKKWSITDPELGARTIEEAKRMYKNNRAELHKGYKRIPLTNVDFNRCVIDLLHLFLRITDTLLELFLYDLFQEDGNESKEIEKRPNLKRFSDFLKIDCRISNPFYLKDSKEFKLRSLNGNEKKKIFEKANLVALFPNIKNINLINSLWFEFLSIYNYIKSIDENNVVTESENFETMLAEWLVLFLKCYFPDNITPYIHAFVFHVPEFLRIFKNLDIFNLQSLEKLNDICTTIYQKSTNKHNYFNKHYIQQMLEKRNRMEYFEIKF